MKFVLVLPDELLRPSLTLSDEVEGWGWWAKVFLLFSLWGEEPLWLEELALPIFMLNTITNFSNLIFCCWNLTFVFVCFQRRKETVFLCVFWQVWESPFSTSKMIFNVLTIKRRREIRFLLKWTTIWDCSLWFSNNRSSHFSHWWKHDISCWEWKNTIKSKVRNFTIVLSWYIYQNTVLVLELRCTQGGEGDEGE